MINNEDYAFTARSRKPPRSEINALISFGNTVMYQLVAKEIYKTSLDIRIGYLHSATVRHESLNLDIAEIFKPILVDRAIFTVVNKNMLNSSLHFEKKGQAVLLNREGKARFVAALYEKLNNRFEHGAERITYAALIQREVENCRKALVEGTRYKPFKYY